MTARRHLCGLALAAALGTLPAAGLARAQDRPPPDSLAADPNRRPAAVTDSAGGPSRRFTPPAAVAPGPLAPGTRIVFTRDSLDWFEGYTLADLLGTLPGAYVVRAGFVNQPHPVTYAGRGADPVEIFWDGIPFLPVGPDSGLVDPGRISLVGLDRVEVEVLPAGLRVFLVTERHVLPEARSLIRVVSGALETAGYAGLFQYQWPGGLALNLRGDFFSTEGSRESPREDRWFDLWAKLDWAPTATAGASWQIRSQQYQRTGIGEDGPGTTRPRDGTRRDVLLRLFASQRPGGYGLGVDAGFASTGWDDADSTVTSPPVRQAFLGFGWRRHDATFRLTGRVGDGHYRAGLDARAGWVPLPGIVLAGDAALREYPDAGRTARAHGSLGLYAGPVSLTGEAAAGELLAVPRFPDDTVQSTTDLGLRLGLDLGRIGGHAGIARRGAYDPHVPPGLPGITSVLQTPEATWFLTDVRLQPWRELTIDAWYSTPTGDGTADFQPPQHGRVAVTFRSNFFHTFRSGAFDLKLRYGIEYWSAWTAGLSAGMPVAVPGATFHDAFIQFRIVDFLGFWRLQNLRNSRGRYAPELEYPRSLQTFGVKWEFSR